MVRDWARYGRLVRMRLGAPGWATLNTGGGLTRVAAAAVARPGEAGSHGSHAR